MMNARHALISMDLFLCIAMAALLSINHEIDAGQIERAENASERKADTADISIVVEIGANQVAVRGMDIPLTALPNEPEFEEYMATHTGQILFVISGDAPWSVIDGMRAAVQAAAPERTILYQAVGGNNG